MYSYLSINLIGWLYSFAATRHQTKFTIIEDLTSSFLPTYPFDSDLLDLSEKVQ